MSDMLESKLVWFFSAAVLQAATALTALEGQSPSTFQAIVIGIGALAQGLLAWRLFVKEPPKGE